MSELKMITMIERNQSALDEIYYTMNNIDHLESILIDKKRLRKTELEKIRKEYDQAIQAYSGVILKLLA
jgi:DNA transposition AAA+ family ATPase